MNKKTSKKATMLGLGVLGAALLASCQICPVNANTIITDQNGAGSKTISLFSLVDGSIQIAADSSFEGNSNYFYIDDATFENPTFTSKADAYVSYAKDGYFTNPNGKATVAEMWTEWNERIKSIIPTGFSFSIDTKQSSGWNDSYMELSTADMKTTNTTNEWKAYVYHLTYSWNNVEEYISKTKTLIGSTNYAVSELAELDDAGTAWASLTKNSDDTYTWKECYTVNYWSVYGYIDTMIHGDLFNAAALGADFAVATSSAFSISMQQYKIGDGEETKIKIDNTSTTDKDGNVKFVSATGKIAKKTNVVAIVAGVAGGIVAIGVIAALVVFFNKRKKKASK